MGKLHVNLRLTATNIKEIQPGQHMYTLCKLDSVYNIHNHKADTSAADLNHNIDRCFACLWGMYTLDDQERKYVR